MNWSVGHNFLKSTSENCMRKVSTNLGIPCSHVHYKKTQIGNIHEGIYYLMLVLTIVS